MPEHAHPDSATAPPVPPDPRRLVQDSPMSRPQYQAVALTGALSALDGYDLLATSFVAPALARAFAVDAGTLGVLLAAGLAGSLVGSVALAPLADVVGRRPVVFISLAIMTLGMAASALCTALVPLTLVRVATGIGIGAMVVVINPLAAEMANRHRRSFALAMMSLGYPLGGAVGGLVAGVLLAHLDWRAVFGLGAVVAVLLVPLVARYLPESLAFLLQRRDARSLDRVNAILVRFGHAAVTELPPPAPRGRTPYREILRGRQLVVTLLVCLVSVLMFMTIYFFLSWLPTLLVGAGLSGSAASSVAGASSIAGALACIGFGLLSRRVDGRLLGVVAVLGLGLSVLAFGLVPSAVLPLVITALVTGGFVAAGTVGLYVIAADVFSAGVRATGTGLVVGVGRVGSALAPAVSGALFAAGGGRGDVAAVMAAGAILAGLVLLVVRRRRLSGRPSVAAPELVVGGSR